MIIPPMPSITALAYELAHKAMLEGWEIKIDMNKGGVKHNIYLKPGDILPNSDLGNHPSISDSGDWRLRCEKLEAELERTAERVTQKEERIAELKGTILDLRVARTTE